ncbi:MAG: PTS sugar transporter subunit IIC [Elusimicrobia bacterium]|nr:PTS sugar transporter subunit IIC [Elusimicrobiota bacterium]MBU2615269.1 PTS sugar transporter subunit IIC [Elusimicrobiota bacterium]
MFLIAFISMFLALDNAIGNFMISRPFISGIITGYFMGDIKTGLLIGTFIEIVWIDVFPIGTYVAPELMVSAILSVYWSLAPGGSVQFHTVALAIGLAVPLSIFFRIADVWNRQFNSKLLAIMEKRVDKGKENAVSIYVYISLLIFAAKAFLFFIVFLPLGNVILDWAESIIPLFVKQGLDASLKFIPVLGFAVAFNFFRKKKYEST